MTIWSLLTFVIFLGYCRKESKFFSIRGNLLTFCSPLQGLRCRGEAPAAWSWSVGVLAINFICIFSYNLCVICMFTFFELLVLELDSRH